MIWHNSAWLNTLFLIFYLFLSFFEMFIPTHYSRFFGLYILIIRHFLVLTNFWPIFSRFFGRTNSANFSRYLLFFPDKCLYRQILIHSLVIFSFNFYYVIFTKARHKFFLFKFPHKNINSLKIFNY